MIKTSLYLFFVSSGAVGLSVTYPALLDYYYSIMVFIGVVFGARTMSFAYSGMMVLMVAVYAIENNSQAWHVDIHMLSAVYFITAFMILIFRTDDGFKISYIIAGLISFKWGASMLFDNGYALHTLLNFLSIAQWIVFTKIASDRIKLNKGYAGKDSPFMLKLAVTWNQFKTRLGIMKSV